MRAICAPDDRRIRGASPLDESPHGGRREYFELLPSADDWGATVLTAVRYA